MSSLHDIPVAKSGWLEKYSVGRGLIPLKNWQRRWFTVDHSGLNYSKTQFEPASRRTFVPFIANASAANGDVIMAAVYLYPAVTAAIHPEATDASMFYFALRFQERGTPRVLLIRTQVREDYELWTRFMAMFVHAAPMSGVPPSHPASAKRGVDPDELDPREKIVLRQAVLEWDEGTHFRVGGDADTVHMPCSFEDCTVWASDDEGGSPARNSRRNSSPAATPPSTANARVVADDYDCL